MCATRFLVAATSTHPLFGFLCVEEFRLDGDHGFLGRREVPSLEIDADDVRNGRTVVFVLREARLDAQLAASSVSVATVEDSSIREDDGLAKSVFSDVLTQFAKLTVGHRREKVGGRVRL